MKILHVAPYFHGAWAYGGIPRLAFNLAAAQAKAGHRVDAVTTDVFDRDRRLPAAEYGRAYEREGVNVRVYPNLSNRLAYDLQLFLPRGLYAERVRIRDYDIVHVHGHRNLLNHRMTMMAREARVPVVLMPNGTMVNIERRLALKRGWDWLLGNRQLRAVRALVAVSEAERGQFIGLGVPPQKIRVIPNPVEMDCDNSGIDFKRTRGLGDYLLYLGKITPRKGIEHIVQALPLLDREDLVLVIAGNDMGYRRQLESLASSLELACRVVFTGLLTGAEKAAAYRGALYTVYAGTDEIFGLVPWESILCGAPVIVAGDCGCGEWIAAAGAGHVVPYANPAAIALAVNRRDPAEDAKMVERGQAYARESLSRDAVAARMIEYYRDLTE